MNAFMSACALLTVCIFISCADHPTPTISADAVATGDSHEPARQTSALLREDEQPPDQDNDHFVTEVDCNDHDPYTHPNAPETCDFKDNNCNGLTDEPWSLMKPDAEFYRKPCIAYTVTDTGVYCASSGIWVCDASGQRLVCSAGPAVPHTEKCNDEDDNCDGLVDNGPGWPQMDSSCDVGIGVCTRSGIWACDAYSGEPYCTAEDETPPTGCSTEQSGP